jgi:glycosyltransferase involved in cell wall biosynthesis
MSRDTGNTLPMRPLESVVCFGGEDWWYHNRGHIDMQLMRRFAATAPVLYVNSVVMRKWNVSEGAVFLARLKRKAASILRGARRVDGNFTVYSPLTLPVHHLPLARQANSLALTAQTRLLTLRMGLKAPLIWVACPAACDTALALPRGRLAYQRTDRHEEYPGVDRKRITAYDRALKREADVTFYVNRRMLAEEHAQCRKAVFLDHGVDFDRFSTAVDSAFAPPEMEGLRRPVVGYFGDIDGHIVDVPLLEAVADMLPEMTFVFIGTSTTDVDALGRRPNVVLIPRRPYEVIPHYGKAFDAAIMPWRKNEWIESCNPVKLKEYLALGKPVISTPFSELACYEGVVERASGAADFAETLRKAVREDCPSRVAARQARVRDCTWDSRARLALDALRMEARP